MKVSLGTIEIMVRAPREALFQRFNTFENSDPAKEDGERANVIERHENRLIVEFFSQDGKQMHRTLEEVKLYPSDRVTFRHLEGPLNYAFDEFTLRDAPDGTLVTFTGTIEFRVRLLPGMGWLIARLYVRAKYRKLVGRHMSEMKASLEEANKTSG